MRQYRGSWLTLSLAVVAFCASCVGNFAQVQTTASDTIEIVTIFHGIPLDKDGRAIDIDEVNLPAYYKALAQRAFNASAKESRFKQILFESPTMLAPDGALEATSQNAVGQMDFIIDTLLSEGSISDDVAHRLRLQLHALRQIAQRNGPTVAHSPGIEFDSYLGDYKTRTAAPSTENYIACSDPNVPMPLNYGDARWTNAIDLGRNHSFFVYLQGWKDELEEYPAKISFYQPEQMDGPAGLCAMLERYKIKATSEKERHLELVGVICESAKTNKACFWENRLRHSGGELLLEEQLAKKEYQDIYNSWSSSAQGSWPMTCESCHVGDNTFIFYKGTELCPDNNFDFTCYKGMVGKSKHGISTIIGFEGQSQRITDIKESGVSTNNKCAGCHSLVSYVSKAGNVVQHDICKIFAFVVERKMMPPYDFHSGLEWSGELSDHPYQPSVNELYKFCSTK